MESYEFLLFLAIILISTKVLGLFSRKSAYAGSSRALAAGIIFRTICIKTYHTGWNQRSIP